MLRWRNFFDYIAPIIMKRSVGPVQGGVAVGGVGGWC